jgi:repressor protein CI
MTPLTERALVLVKLAGSAAALARVAGVSAPSVSDWISGKTLSIKAKNAALIAQKWGLNPLWVSDGIGEKFAVSKKGAEETPLVSPGDSRLPIKRALFKLSAGVSGYEIEYENGESDPIFMSHNWFEKNNFRPGKLIAISVQGRSMEPKMYDGDLVIVNTESTIPKDGVVFAINYEGEMVIKRMKRDSGQWFITSDNPDKVRFGDKLCTENCFLLGEVVYLQTETI